MHWRWGAIPITLYILDGDATIHWLSPELTWEQFERRLKMDKARLIKILEKIPAELIDNAYVVNICANGTTTIQIRYDSRLVAKYNTEFIDRSFSIDSNGFLTWFYKMPLGTGLSTKIVMT